MLQIDALSQQFSLLGSISLEQDLPVSQTFVEDLHLFPGFNPVFLMTMEDFMQCPNPEKQLIP